MTTVTLDRPPAGVTLPTQPVRRRHPWHIHALIRVARAASPNEARVTFVLAAALYLATGTTLVLHYGVIDIDSISRVANASYVLDSRYPHLAAIGFVWNPLPSLADLPLIPFAHFWPVLRSHGFAGAITSALFMAGAVVLLLGILRDFGCSRPVRYVLTVLFALDPMIVLYGSTGMSEASMVFTLMLATRMLARWLRTGDPGDLVRTGLALGLAYTARYEALAPGAATVVLVAGIAFLRGRGGIRSRLQGVATDGLLVGFPFLVSVGLWAVASKVLVHAWFPTITSSYGNSTQVANVAGLLRKVTGQGTPQAVSYVGHQLFGLEPLLVVAAGLAIAFAFINRDNRVLAPLVVLGTVLVFDAGAFLSGNSFGWLRFYITSIPLAVLLAACVPAARIRRSRRMPKRAVAAAALTAGRLVANAALASTAVALVAPGLPSTWHTMMSHKYGREEARDLTAIFYPKQAQLGDIQALNGLHVERAIASYVDRMHLPDGAVLTDSGNAFGILMSTRNLHAFTITSDLDFERAVADPPRFHIRYLLVPGKSGYDAIESSYPGIYANGGGFSTLVHQWGGYGYSPPWRLYRITNDAYIRDYAFAG